MSEIAGHPPAENLEGAAPQPVRFKLRLPERKPVVVYALMALTIFVFALQYLTQAGALHFGSCPYFSTLDLPACYGLKVNDLIIAGQWWRLITPIFLHANIIHIAFNMYALNVLGPELERHYGRFPFLALYVVSGFAGVVLSFLLTDAPSLGASTSIFGLLAAQGIFVYRNQRLFGKRARTALASIINIAVINLLIGLAPGIDDWGHVGGLLGGLIFSGLAGPKYEVVEGDAEYRLVNHTAAANAALATLAVAAIFGALAFLRAR